MTTRISRYLPGTGPVPVATPVTEAERQAVEANPFMPIQGGSRDGTRNLTAISRLVKRDPGLARKLCREAKCRESDWFDREGEGKGSMLKQLGR